jgi:hypothetical protein
MSKLQKLYEIAKHSKEMQIAIKYGDEVVKFNLHKELITSEQALSLDIKRQPTVYAFLGLVEVSLRNKLSEIEARANRVYSEAYLAHKKKLSVITNKPYSDDVARHSASVNPKYLKLLAVRRKLEKDHGTVKVCLKAFEQRKDLIQTASANRRKELS